MSHEATNWAWKQPVPNSGAKFVLLAMANRANPDQRGRVVAFTSIKYITDATAQDRKTVVANIARLREWGLIEDTGERVGRTKQVPVYELRCPPDLFSEYTQIRNGSENGTVPKKAANGPVFPAKQAQKRDTDSAFDSSVDSREVRSPSGSRLPPDWNPSEAELEFARTARPDLDLQAEVEKFRDYWHGVAGAAARKADWPATWRNWIRRAAAPKPTPGQPVAGSTAAAPQRDWRQPSETPLERAIAAARHLRHLGAIDDVELARQIEQAHAKHGKEASA